jgi:cyclic-di-AMP phosphodiesterase PgpH
LRALPNIARYAAVLGTLMALSFLFPTNAQFKYRFQLGQMWLYDDLTANIDFPIKKTLLEVSDEKNLIEREAVPIYEVGLESIREKKASFQLAFVEQLRLNKSQFTDVTQNTDAYLNYGSGVVERFLTRGILQPDTFLKNKDRDFLITILRGNILEKQTLGSLLTPQKMSEWFSDSLPYSGLAEPEFLLPLLEQILKPNLIHNAEKTRIFRQQEVDKISATRGMVKTGEMIIQKGGLVTPVAYQKLISYKEQYESNFMSSQRYLLLYVGYFLLCGLVLALMTAYLKFHAAPVFKEIRWLLFILCWLLIYAFLSYAIQASNTLSLYLLPFSILPILIKNFYSRELALVVHLANVLLVALVSSLGFEFVFLQTMAGLVVVFSRFDTRHWDNFFRNISLLTFICVVSYTGFSLIASGNFKEFNTTNLALVAFNGFLTIIAYPLIPLLGNLFGFTSAITLAELSDLNHPLLRELSMKAPGTLQHSLQVANLSEAAAKSIDANELLVKVAALYHDVGKTLNPQYFIENQVGRNAHEDLSYTESARVIIEHVPEGVRLALKFGLPKIVIKFIETHHGTTSVEYFYRLHVRANPENEKDIDLFRYKGPKPKTREQSIMMLADSLEAATKSLKQPDAAAIDELVEKIVGYKIAQNQLVDSQLSFADMEACKESFKQTLKNIHHVRIQYPSEKQVNK